MDSNLDTLCWLLEKARALGADASDAVLFETVDMNASRRLGKPEGLERSENKAVGLRVFRGQKQAIASSTDISREALSDLAEHAVAMAGVTPADPESTLAPVSLHPTDIPELELFDAREPDTKWFEEQCAEAEDAARAQPGITNSEGAEAHFSRSEISLAIANGKINFARSYPTSHFSISVSVVAGNDTDMQRDYDFTSARFRKDLTEAAAVGNHAAKRAVKRLHPRKVASCRVAVVFDPRVSRGLLSIFANAISGTTIARRSSFLNDAMDQAIFSPGITIIDDPHMKRGLGSKPFDAEAVRNKKLVLVENGTLKSWLLDMRTANKLKLISTGHAARGIATPPSPSSTNLYMAKGSLSPEALIKDIKSGLFVTETFGMGINIVTGDFSQGASGFWIENGSIAYPVSEITIAGQLRDMFKNLTAANDLEFRYATNAPTVRIDNMTVAGT